MTLRGIYAAGSLRIAGGNSETAGEHFMEEKQHETR
jgi:hypothetical protein